MLYSISWNTASLSIHSPSYVSSNNGNSSCYSQYVIIISYLLVPCHTRYQCSSIYDIDLVGAEYPREMLLVISSITDLSIFGPWMGHRAPAWTPSLTSCHDRAMHWRNGVSSQEEWGQLRGLGTASAHSFINQSCHSPSLYCFIT